ncbi:BMN2 family [Babesia microti strain RI]|uniref:BMN2 family n=1 Tax=Babesia microti (strain RI) TaxID=1133968 RepID=I7JAY2_BABMR|nr:BMN2 family [Babesia microti strain RI]CCF73999.1 BMN2 family [Babesia microti strain RI]|eukprot:XP_012648608.1 BMN2 family [Babesia microti strain RI]
MMKFNIDKIILINLIVLLNRNVVYCVDTNDVSLSESQSVPTNIDTDNTITNTSNDNLITAKFLSNFNFFGKPLTIGFEYKIDKSQQNKLSDPNKIDKIKFSDYIIEFDDNAKLPTIGTVEGIIIYTCEHNNPVLVEFIVSTEKYCYYYFYPMNNNTNKWNNHKLKHNNGLKKYIDKNGINYYKLPDSRSCCCSHAPIKKYEHTRLAKKHCNEEKCEMLDNIEYKNLEIYLK